MATILIAWELGGNAGHIHPLKAIASKLLNRGHKVLLVVKDVGTAERYLAGSGIIFMQAPVWLGRIDPKTPPAVNFAELLIRVGFLNTEQVAGQIRAWLNLMELVKPDLVLANHSPSIVLATHITGTKTVTSGSGFFSPPTEHPMPSMQPNAKIPKARLLAPEREVLKVINQALIKCGGIPLKTLSGMFDTCNRYLLTLPEADHYGVRKNTRYWGLIQSSKNAVDPAWPKIDGPKVYIYMPHHVQPFRPLLENLQKLGWPSLIVSRNIDQQEIMAFRAPNLTFSRELVNLETVAKQADVVVTNCNHGTVIEMLQRGCRQLVIPLQVEQSMLAYRLSTQGLVVAGGPGIPCYQDLLERVNDNPTLKSNVAKFHAVYGNMHADEQLTAMIDDIEEKIESDTVLPVSQD